MPMESTDWTEFNQKLEKIFKFNNYEEVVKFSNKVMQIAIKLNHHPEISIHYNFVKLCIIDYEIGAISDKCYRFIDEVNKIK